MRIYFHSSIIGVGKIDENSSDVTVAGLSDALTAIADLWHLRYLPSDATVWINGDHPELGVWVLTDRSTHVRIHRSISAGWARMTRSSVKFARTSEAAHTRPLATYTLDDLDLVGHDVKSTILVLHSEHSKRVQFIANSKVAYPVNGTVTFDPFTVVDLQNFTPPEHASTNPVVAADAMINGVSLMTYGAAPERAALVRDNIEAFQFDIDDSLSKNIHGQSEKISKTARHVILKITDQLTRNVHESLAEKSPKSPVEDKATGQGV